MEKDKEYWAEFYQRHRKGEVPSSFAEYVVTTYALQGKRLLELGCGNGRDALFFASKGIETVAVDQVEDEIEYLNSLGAMNLEFVAGDFTGLSGLGSFDCVYSRFTFHAIDESAEDRVMAGLPDLLNPNGFFMLEARSLKDQNLNKEFDEPHYRRYLDFDVTVTKIRNLGFEILESQEARGLAPYKSEDPYVLRVIARRCAPGLRRGFAAGLTAFGLV